LENLPPNLRVLVICPDWQQPAGGVRKLYRHVDVLNASGIPAAIVHQQRGFRCSWFEHQTKIVYEPDVFPPRAGEILLVPENVAWQMMSLTRGVPKVIFNQNAYQTFANVTPEIEQLVAPYNHPDYLASIVVSEDSRAYLNYAFPEHPVYRVHNSVDPALFHCEAGKRPRIAMMARKKKDDAIQVINMLSLRRATTGFEIIAIANQSEANAAAMLRESMVFLSLSTYEGSPMPPMEALACGCVTVGYASSGGAEYVNEQTAFPVAAEDVVGFARRLETVLDQLRKDPQPLLEKARRASAFIHADYSPQREEQDILAAWGQILAPSPLNDRPRRAEREEIS
jgi:hypothetical protein